MIELLERFEGTDITSKNVIKESVDGKSVTRFRGPYIMTGRKNRNGRIYTKPTMKREVKLFNSVSPDSSNRVGELEHPYKKELMSQISLERGCHLIESLEWEGDDVIGTSRVLENLPMGRIVKAYLDEGITLGVSTRGFGTVNESNCVNDDFKIKTIDVVQLPSAQNAYMECIRENYDYIIGTSGDPIVEAAVKQMEAQLSKTSTKNTVLIKEALDGFIASIRTSKGL